MERKCEMCNITLTTNMDVMTHIQKKHADALKKAFSKEVMSKVPSQSKYLDWLKKDHIVNIMTSNRKDLNKEHPKEISNHDGSCFKMTERASGSDIIETQRTIIVPQKNGTDKKTVVKYQMANITTRTRQDSDSSLADPTCSCTSFST